MDTNFHESVRGLSLLFIRVHSCPFVVEPFINPN